MNDALSPAPALTTADLTPTTAEPIESATKYLGVLYAGSSPALPDTPFVLSTVAEAHALLSAVHSGGPVAARVLHGGAIVETTLQSLPVDDVALLLWRMDPAVDLDEEHPHLHVRVGPRGGITHGPA